MKSIGLIFVGATTILMLASVTVADQAAATTAKNTKVITDKVCM